MKNTSICCVINSRIAEIYHIEKNWSFLKVFSFIGFFPTVFSGPILRANLWSNNLKNPIKVDNYILHKSLILISIGCLYKLCFSK